jgi:hydroxyacylglutathione hydrolase
LLLADTHTAHTNSSHQEARQEANIQLSAELAMSFDHKLLPLSPWPKQWIHGSNGEPHLQVHRVCDGLFAIRQSKLLNFEGNFMYLIVGEDRAILVDTGAVNSEECGLVNCVESILASIHRYPIPLVVAHSHSHGDHVQGDLLFTHMENVILVGHGIQAVSQFFSLQIPSFDSSGAIIHDAASFELGGDRCLDIFFIPGHFEDHIALYDRRSGVLLSGDFLYRGRIYVEDRASFLQSAHRLDEFANNNPIAAVLGAHIEMTSSPGVDYPDECLFQPDEPPLSMDLSHIRTLRMVVEHAASESPSDWGVLRTDDFIVVPTQSAPQPVPLIRVALLRKVFVKQAEGPSQTERLSEALLEASALGASVVVLPELPMDEWYPRIKACQQATHEVCEEGLADERIVAMSESARCAGVVLVGGALVRASSLPSHLRDNVTCPEELNSVRNVTLIFDHKGDLVNTHMKRHLPREEGFWEGSHFEAAPGGPSVMRGVVPGLVMAVQTCSDIMRPSAHSLAALGAGLLLNPRATEAASSQKWQRIVSGIAATTAAYVISVPRPVKEGTLDLGGDAFAISPTGDLITSSADSLSVCDVDLLALGRARALNYPGYLDIHAEEYAVAWQQVAALRRSYKNKNF